MKLVDMPVRDYLNILASDAPAPGGGSVSALSAAQGAALVAMVCDLTIPKEKYSQHRDLCVRVKDDILSIYKVSAAFKLPKDTDEQKAARSKAIQEATVTATEVPYETMALCMKGLEITQEIVGKSNSNAASDLGVAALNLLAGLKGAYLNVKINLPSIKDEAIAAGFEEAESMVAQAQKTAEKIYEEVLESL